MTNNIILKIKTGNFPTGVLGEEYLSPIINIVFPSSDSKEGELNILLENFIEEIIEGNVFYLSLLFYGKENYEEVSTIGAYLLENRNNFLCRENGPQCFNFTKKHYVSCRSLEEDKEYLDKTRAYFALGTLMRLQAGFESLEVGLNLPDNMRTLSKKIMELDYIQFKDIMSTIIGKILDIALVTDKIEKYLDERFWKDWVAKQYSEYLGGN
jgi:hypothetical protein